MPAPSGPSPSSQTPPKRFDLMMGVNVRAAYIACYYALPHMVKQQWGHVLNMCPQPHHQTFARQGGVHDLEARHGPRGARRGRGASARQHRRQHALAAHHHRNPGFHQLEDGRIARSGARPEIVCDASLAIFAQEPRTSTGRQWIDEEALAELAGITNFDRLLVRRQTAGPIPSTSTSGNRAGRSSGAGSSRREASVITELKDHLIVAPQSGHVSSFGGLPTAGDRVGPL